MFESTGGGVRFASSATSFGMQHLTNLYYASYVVSLIDSLRKSVFSGISPETFVVVLICTGGLCFFGTFVIASVTSRVITSLVCLILRWIGKLVCMLVRTLWALKYSMMCMAIAATMTFYLRCMTFKHDV